MNMEAEEASLEQAARHAAAAGQWDLVESLRARLEELRRARGAGAPLPSNVVPITPRRRGG